LRARSSLHRPSQRKPPRTTAPTALDHQKKAKIFYKCSTWAKPVGGQRVLKAAASATRVERLGGIGETLAAQLNELAEVETRAVVFGHLLRGGSPTALDRLLGLNFGAAAVRALAEGRTGVMVALNPPRTVYVPLEETVSKLKLVPLDGHAVTTARALDIALGD
jgi:6-phosphofructokinase